MSIDIERIDNSSFLCKFHDKSKKDIIFNIKTPSLDSGIDHNTEFSFNLVKEIASKILENPKDITSVYKIGSQKWMVRPEQKQPSFLQRFFSVFHPSHDEAHIRVDIERMQRPGHAFTAATIYGVTSFYDYMYEMDMVAGIVQQENRFNATTLHEYNTTSAKKSLKKDCQDIPGMIPCSEREIEQGVRGKCRFLAKEAVVQVAFSDPFTTLATLAFQRYENEFAGSDNFTPNNCSYCLVQQDDTFLLVSKNHPLAKDEEAKAKAVKAYKEFIIREYGAEKVRAASYLYQINLDEVLEKNLPLTPEHIYRINIGVNNIETDDARGLLSSLQELKQKLLTTSADSYLKVMDESLLESPFAKRQLGGLISAIKSDYPQFNKEAVTQWLGAFDGVKTIEEMPSTLFQKLMKVFSLSEEERKRVFTGRAIYTPIHQEYTLAETTTYKPWVDQQELLHTFAGLKKTSDWNVYYEKIAHVLCKKHLARAHPDKGYAVGALVPAPLSSSGQERWYKVSQVVYNGYGMMCYTLESPCQDSTLPTIKLYRSTASNEYAMFGKKTIRLDLNPINPVGYEGKGKTDKYENADFESLTIPLWVGCLLQAGQSLEKKNLQEAFLQLKLANDELYYAEEAKCKVLNFKDILRKHDGILNSLFTLNVIDYFTYEKLRGSFIYQPEFKENQAQFIEQQKEVGQQLINKILEFKKNNSQKDQEKDQETDPGHLSMEMDGLVRDIRNHLLSYKAEDDRNEYLRDIGRKVLDGLYFREDQALAYIKMGAEREAVQEMIQWEKELRKYAREIKEDPSFKKPKDISLVGHSLGGGLAQVYTLHHFIDKRRIPCPGHTCSTFAFDAPGIRRDDNERYKQFMINHGTLFKEQNIHFSVYHQHEAGDPVAASGRHLGSANSAQEGRVLQENIEFSGRVMKRKPHPQNPEVADSKVVHATQFLSGKEGVDYTKTSFTPYELGLVESSEHIRDLQQDEARQKSKDLQDRVWEFPFSPQFTESFRSSSIIYSIASKMFSNWIEHEQDMKPYLDQSGNFVADEHGVVL